MDWPIVASNVFMPLAIAALVASPIAGITGGWRSLPVRVQIGLGALLAGSFCLLATSWRGIPGGIRAAAFGHVALVILIAAFAELGRMTRAILSDRLAAALVALGLSAVLVLGIFALAPLTENISSTQSLWLLAANPLVAVTSAAGIDLLHLDTIYRISPLAHRGVAVPAWTTTCVVYAAVGLAAFGASRIRPWSPRS